MSHYVNNINHHEFHVNVALIFNNSKVYFLCLSVSLCDDKRKVAKSQSRKVFFTFHLFPSVPLCDAKK